jgi:transposase-like protein
MSTYPTHHREWHPPHCPNRDCKYHNNLQSDWPVIRFGYFWRQAHPRRIRRYRCQHCGVTFSSQTFDTTYYLKRPDILPKLMTKATGGMANRQIADDLGVCPATIDNQLNRLGRHCLLFHRQISAHAPVPPIVAIDGFESFELSQYHPFHFHLAVACDSGLFLSFTDSPLRRKGAMTPRQRAKRERLEAAYGRPDPQAVRQDVAALLADVIGQAASVTIRSDGHRSYRPAIGRLKAAVRHQVTSSQDYRDRHNPLYEINLLDLLIRHGVANHRRETLAWAKRRQGAAWRLMIFLVWRNYVRMRWRKRCRQTPAMQAGLLKRALTVKEVLKRRLFVSQAGLTGRWRQYYWGEIQTPALGVNREHRLKRAA